MDVTAFPIPSPSAHLVPFQPGIIFLQANHLSKKLKNRGNLALLIL
jgi:hypothetical protein